MAVRTDERGSVLSTLGEGVDAVIVVGFAVGSIVGVANGGVVQLPQGDACKLAETVA